MCESQGKEDCQDLLRNVHSLTHTLSCEIKASGTWLQEFFSNQYFLDLWKLIGASCLQLNTAGQKKPLRLSSVTVSLHYAFYPHWPSVTLFSLPLTTLPTPHLDPHGQQQHVNWWGLQVKFGGSDTERLTFRCQNSLNEASHTQSSKSTRSQKSLLSKRSATETA